MGLRRALRALLTAGKGIRAGMDEHALAEAGAGADPLVLFERWFRDARDAGFYLPEAMTVATATPDGAPSARQVLLRGYDERGFVFFTNYRSRKAAEIEMNPRAALLLHWPTLHRQVRIEGTVTRTSAEESETYHRTRPRASRIAAWASEQSAEIDGRDAIERNFRDREREFGSGDIPLPDFWGGYRVWAERIEFWQGRSNRLHDRLLFRRTHDGRGWHVSRLSP